MLKEAMSILGSDRVEGCAYRLNQSLAAPSRYPPQQRLDLGPRIYLVYVP